MPLLNICHIEMMDQISTRILWVFYVSADYAMSVRTFYPVCVMQCDVSGPFAVAELFVKKNIFFHSFHLLQTFQMRFFSYSPLRHFDKISIDCSDS